MASILRGDPRVHGRATSHNRTIVITLRPAQAGDAPLLFQMLRESAVAQGSPDALAVTEADLLEDGFGPHPRFQCVIAEVDQTPAGMALYFFNYSTWVSRQGLYLEDLYVTPKFRRGGVARALLDHLAVIARNEGCRRMQWLVHRNNHAAIRLYQSFGARLQNDWILMSKLDALA
jgi:GNAT superfamily N-acetyltransferase